MFTTLVHNNSARVDGDIFKVDRKFHVGMQAYASKIRSPIMTVNPEMDSDETVMDMVEVPVKELGYSVMTLKVDRRGNVEEGDSSRLADQIGRSRLVYGSSSYQTAKLSRRLKVPYIMLLEYDLKTQITATASQVAGVARKGVRAMRCSWDYSTAQVPAMRNAHSLHCNGYPIFDESKWTNTERLLYLDSRMSADLLIAEDRLKARLAQRGQRPLRLLYSGRYERMKGADDAVLVALDCLDRGLDVELHCYGQGSLRAEMAALAARRPDRIKIHDAITYPELAQEAQSFDLFVCCHVQSDPSCTYLESFGAGLPIVGYGNRMWRRLQEESRAGLCSPLGDIGAVADDISKLASDPSLLAATSMRARSFAAEHTFEEEFNRRTDAINAALER